MNKIFAFFCLFFLLHISLSAQDESHTLNIEIIGKTYDSLYIGFIGKNLNCGIVGKTKDKHNWTFQYSDSIYQRHQFVRLYVKTPKDSITNLFDFYIILEKDTIGTSDFFLEKGIYNLSLTYKSSDVINLTPEEIRDKIPNQYWKIEFCKLNTPIRGELAKVYTSAFTTAIDKRNDTLYSKQLKNNIELAKEYPDSHYFMGRLYSSLTKYRSQEDVKRVFDRFSSEIQKSYYGELVDKYIRTLLFQNTTLPRWDNNESENVIQNPSKFNLIVFSASWCAPCHKTIPILKEIHNALNRNLDIAYISLDEANTIQGWRKLMIKEEISWRSLIAGDKLNEVKQMYYVPSIPFSLIVHPDGSFEQIDVRRNEDKEKLYRLINNN